MKKLSPRQIAVLRSAPIGVDSNDHSGDPQRTPSYIYHGADGRTASALWHRGYLSYRAVSPHGDSSGGLLSLTDKGREALS